MLYRKTTGVCSKIHTAEILRVGETPNPHKNDTKPVKVGAQQLYSTELYT